MFQVKRYATVTKTEETTAFQENIGTDLIT